MAPPETSVRSTAAVGKSLFSSSLLFAIVRHCSAKNIVLRQCPRDAQSLLRCALSLGMARLRAARGVPSRCPRTVRSGNTSCWVFTSHESRNMVFLVPPATPRRPTPSPTNGLFPKHETRITKHGFSGRPVAAFLCAVARHGRPWSGMGGILPPRLCPRSRQPFSVGLTTSTVRRATPSAADVK